VVFSARFPLHCSLPWRGYSRGAWQWLLTKWLLVRFVCTALSLACYVAFGCVYQRRACRAKLARYEKLLPKSGADIFLCGCAVRQLHIVHTRGANSRKHICMRRTHFLRLAGAEIVPPRIAFWRAREINSRNLAPRNAYLIHTVRLNDVKLKS
jgi:hypothetical protein